jgi:hypothetical protein
MKFYNADSVMETVGDPIGDYTIIYRYTGFEPWVCAWLLKEGKGETEVKGMLFPNYYWCQGHYFEKFEDAVAYAIENTR